jgi:multidrug transporter EmrE-like cation transporter
VYARYMLLAFVTNGLGAFGLRILAGAGVGDKYYLQYLSLWYLGGCLVAVYPYLRDRKRPNGQELFLSVAMATCSVFGQLGMLLALSRNLPGFVVFPVATGGGLLLVLAVGILFFHERLSAAGYLGIALGTAALILLALP